MLEHGGATTEPEAARDGALAARTPFVLSFLRYNAATCAPSRPRSRRATLPRTTRCEERFFHV